MEKFNTISGIKTVSKGRGFNIVAILQAAVFILVLIFLILLIGDM